jgi:ABC-type glycerol-3-phosphate transport system permease component
LPGTIDRKPTVHTDALTGLQYLLGSKQVLFETGVILPRAAFDKYTNGDDKTMLSELLESAATEAKNFNFDFAYAKSTGTLRRKKGSGTNKNFKNERIRELESVIAKQEEELEKRAKEEFEEIRRGDKETTNKIEAIRTVLESKAEKKDTPLLFSSLLFVIVIMTVVGIGSAVMSAYHTTLFLFHGGRPFWISALTGVLFILFSTTAFTAARYFLCQKTKWIGGVFALAGVVVVLYSVFATLAVNFNQFREGDEQRTVVFVEDNEALIAHERLINDNRDALAEVTERITLLQNEAEHWRTLSWRRFDEFQVSINEAYQARTELRQRQIELESFRPELITLVESSQETIFTLVARLFHIREDGVRFFVYAAPACLYDILAPFALSVVLLLADRRKRREAA